MRDPHAERGFTLIELMIVVAIIAVLAAVVVPTFMRESARGKYKSEVTPMFAELATREDQYQMENGVFLAAAACPSAASKTGNNPMTACLATTTTDWSKLRVQPSSSTIYCSYTVTVGKSTDTPAPPSWVTGLTTPSTYWYFMTAACPNTNYFTASWDNKVRSQDGK